MITHAYQRHIYILIMFAKFQNFYTRIAPCTMAKFNSSLKIAMTLMGHHCNLGFYSLDPGSKLDWYKRCHCRAKSSFGVQNSSSGKSMVSKFSFIFQPFQIIFTFFLPPVPFYSSPLSTFPFLLVSQQHGCKKHINC